MNLNRMSHRYPFPFLLMLIAPVAAWGQANYTRVHNRMLDEAKMLLAVEDHVEAAKIYRRLENVDTTFAEVAHELGLCYAQIPGARHKAAPLFERALRNGHPEALYHLGLARHRQERFDEAIDLLNRYKATKHRLVADAEVDRSIAICRNAKALVRTPVDLTVRNLGALINSPAHDYCPLVTADGNTMYFTSRREGTTGGLKDPDGQWFEDIYMARRVDEVWSNAVNAGVPLNTALQDATVGLSADGTSMIIYRTGQGLVSGDLFESKRSVALWNMPELMTERINSEHHEPSATLSPDGEEIYFTSDRPVGYGGRDLYRIRRLPNGEWSLPMNLGPTINTPFDEDAPFLHSDGTTLFFSSNGHGTMGGYDIFKSVMLDHDQCTWGDPENMGYPLNTVNDDIYFCLSEDGTTGYFSSERPGGLGAQDIYQVIFPSSQLEFFIVRGLVVDHRDEPLRARIVVEDEAREEIVGVYNTNAATGRYLMVLKPGARYHLRTEAEGHAVVEEVLTATAPDQGREISKETQLLPLEQVEGMTRNER